MDNASSNNSNGNNNGVKTSSHTTSTHKELNTMTFPPRWHITKDKKSEGHRDYYNWDLDGLPEAEDSSVSAAEMDG